MAGQTDRVFSWGDVRVNRSLPNGFYDFQIEGLEEKWSQEKGMLMYVMTAKVLAPESQKGKTHVEYMLFGKSPFETDRDDEEFQAYAALEDLEAEDPLTARYSNGMRTFKKIFEAAGIEGLDGSEEVGMNSIMNRADSGGLTFGARVTVREEENGRTSNMFGQCYPIGGQTPRIEEPKPIAGRRGGASTGRGPTPSRGEARARTRRASEEDDD